MSKYDYIYAKPQDVLWFLGGRNCIEKATSYILKVRYYNNNRLLDIFLEDITPFLSCDGKELKNLWTNKKIYELNKITGNKNTSVEQLKHALDTYGEVIIIISTNGLPYKVNYDIAVLNPDSGRHAVAAIGYDKEYFYILESEKYIGNGYEHMSTNPSIGKCKIADLERCMNEYLECMEVRCELKDKKKIDKYTTNIMQVMKRNRNREDQAGYYGLTAIKKLYCNFLEASVPYEFYSDTNVMEISNLIQSRNVLKHYFAHGIKDKKAREIFETLLDESCKHWTKLMRIVMRRRANDRERKYDNSDVCNLFQTLYDIESKIYDQI